MDKDPDWGEGVRRKRAFWDLKKLKNYRLGVGKKGQ